MPTISWEDDFATKDKIGILRIPAHWYIIQKSKFWIKIKLCWWLCCLVMKAPK